jgi:hypothetical protein
LLALAGVFMLAAAVAATIAIWLPWPVALAISAVIFLLSGGIAMWLGVQPSNPKNDDLDAEQASAAALALVDLPLEAAKKIITQRPIAAVVLVSGFGLLIARKPQIALKVVDKILERFS